jgi:hypothetical protein
MSTAATTTASRSTAAAKRPVWFWPAIGLGVALVLVVIGFVIAGPRAETLPTAYGKRRGGEGARSVSGTSVLAELYKQAGHRATTLTRLSPRLDKWEVIVWAPDDFAAPTKEQREFLESWLAKGTGRVVVYIGRDYDAAIAYWEKVKPTAPPEKTYEFQRQLARAKAEHAAGRGKMPTDEYARWFTVRRDGQLRDVSTLAGPWADGIDAKKTAIRVEGRLDLPVEKDVGKDDPPLPEDFELLLESNGDPLATRVTDTSWGDGQVIVLTNGSFVLNYPLVNREHRKLAARLVAECGPAPKKVVFIESGAGGPPVLDKEPTASETSPLAFLNVWPLNAIVLHLTILGIIFCVARSPIFGRPRELPAEPAADFGKHVGALGDLLARTQDRNYAQSRLAQYRQIGKRESGKSHLKGK